MRRDSPRTRVLVVLAVALMFALGEIWPVLSGPGPGLDFLPLRHAAEALARGESIFADPDFVYPPTAALVLLPAALGSELAAFRCWVILGVAALGSAAWLIVRAAPPRLRPHLAGIAVLALLGSSVAHRSIFLGNMSELLVPVAVGVLLAFERGRWTLGCALLAASLLLKPMLVPLVLIPVLGRRWAALARTMIPAGLALLAATLLVPGGRHFAAVLRYCLTGTNLHGENAVNNLSLRGWAEGRHAPGSLAVMASIAVAVVVAGRIAAEWRGGRPPAAWLGTLLLLGVFLAGAISEVHFLLAALATTLLHLTALPARRWLAYAPGLAVLGLPAAYPDVLLGAGPDAQNLLVVGELALLAAACLPASLEPWRVGMAPCRLPDAPLPSAPIRLGHGRRRFRGYRR